MGRVVTTNGVAGGSGAHATRAMTCMLGATALISLNDAIIKTLTSWYPVGELLLLRGFFVLPWIMLIAYFSGGLGKLRITNFKGQSLRAIFMVAGSFFFVSGLIYLPLADAIAVTFTGPLFITALAPLMLGEKVGLRRWIAVLVGFAGVLFMVRPGNDAMQIAVLLPLAGALSGGVRDLLTRRISQTESSSAVLLFTTLCVMLFGLTTTPFAWSPIRYADIGYFAASGALVAVGQYFMIEAFRWGEAALVAPFKYSFMIWAILFGYLFFGDLPDGWTLFGAAVVCASGLYILHRELRYTRRPMAAGPRTPAR
jgi:drug/metabolite transporter (DMT)-like permease